MRTVSTGVDNKRCRWPTGEERRARTVTVPLGCCTGPACRLGFAGGWLLVGRPPRCRGGLHLAACPAGDVYPLTFTSRLTTGQFTTNPLGPNGLPAGKPVAFPLETCARVVEKSVWRTFSP